MALINLENYGSIVIMIQDIFRYKISLCNCTVLMSAVLSKVWELL